jgi:hypothetical protein
VGLGQFKVEISLKRAQRAAPPHFQDLLEAAVPLLCSVDLVQYCQCSTRSKEDPSGSPNEEGGRGRTKSKGGESEFRRRKAILAEKFIALWEGEHASESSPVEASLPILGIGRWGRVSSPRGCKLNCQFGWLAPHALRWLFRVGSDGRDPRQCQMRLTPAPGLAESPP